MSRLSSWKRLSTIASVVFSVNLLHLEKFRWMRPVQFLMISIAWESRRFWLLEMHSHWRLLTWAMVLNVSPEINMQETKLQKVRVLVLVWRILIISLSVTKVFWAMFWGRRGETSNLEITPFFELLSGTLVKAILFLFKKVSKFLPLNKLPKTVWLWGNLDFCWIFLISASIIYILLQRISRGPSRWRNPS